MPKPKTSFLAKPTSRGMELSARQTATKILRKAKNTPGAFPSHRLPSFSEYHRISRALRPSTISMQEPDTCSVYKAVNELRRSQMDRLRLKRVKSVIDQKPNKIRMDNVLNVKRITSTIDHKQEIFSHNLNLLRRINEIQRLHGCVESFNQTPYPRHNSRFLKLNHLKERNRELGCRLLAAKSKLDTHNVHVPPLPKAKVDAPEPTVRKYRHLMPDPSVDWQHAQALLRPVIYFDLAAKPKHPLGRILIQLYTEVSPQVVLEFVRLATYNDVAAHQFLRIFPDLWIEGELTASTPNLRESNRTSSPLDASKQSGLLSYAWEYRKGFPHGGLLNYTISFKPLAVVPLRRVVFGQVFGGVRVLQMCRDFGTKKGNPTKFVEVTQCGLL